MYGNITQQGDQLDLTTVAETEGGEPVSGNLRTERFLHVLVAPVCRGGVRRLYSYQNICSASALSGFGSVTNYVVPN